jgi:hypothetical protein
MKLLNWLRYIQRKISTMKKFWNEVVFNLMLQHKILCAGFFEWGQRGGARAWQYRRSDAQLKEISQ